MRPPVSWLIPCHNEPVHFIKRCLFSLCLEPLDEVVWVDDGSTNPETLEFTEKVIGNARNHTLVRMPVQSGVAAALNKGLYACSKKLIARIDADDWCERGRINRQFEGMDSSASVIGCGMQLIDPENHRQILKLHPGGDAETLLRSGYPLCYHPTWLARFDDIKAAGFYPTAYPHGEDFALSCEMHRRGMRFQNVNEALVYKCQHAKRSSVVYRKEQSASVASAVRNILGFNGVVKPVLDAG